MNESHSWFTAEPQNLFDWVISDSADQGENSLCNPIECQVWN